MKKMILVLFLKMFNNKHLWEEMTLKIDKKVPTTIYVFHKITDSDITESIIKDYTLSIIYT